MDGKTGRQGCLGKVVTCVPCGLESSIVVDETAEEMRFVIGVHAINENIVRHGCRKIKSTVHMRPSTLVLRKVHAIGKDFPSSKTACGKGVLHTTERKHATVLVHRFSFLKKGRLHSFTELTHTSRVPSSVTKSVPFQALSVTKMPPTLS